MALDPHHGPTHVHDEVSSVSSVHSPFGVAQVVSLVLGIVYTVIGAIGLARTGFDEITRDAAAVGAFRMTALLALIHLMVGLILLGGAAGRLGSRSVGMVMGPMLIAAGIIALIQPVRALGWNDAVGVLYLVSGIALMVAAILTPPAVVRRTGVTGTYR